MRKTVPGILLFSCVMICFMTFAILADIIPGHVTFMNVYESGTFIDDWALYLSESTLFIGVSMARVIVLAIIHAIEFVGILWAYIDSILSTIVISLYYLNEHFKWGTSV